jgi:hypothetical protein
MNAQLQQNSQRQQQLMLNMIPRYCFGMACRYQDRNAGLRPASARKAGTEDGPLTRTKMKSILYLY